LDDEIGSLEVGKQADIIAVKADTPRMTPFFADGPYFNLQHNLVHACAGSDVPDHGGRCHRGRRRRSWFMTTWPTFWTRSALLHPACSRAVPPSWKSIAMARCNGWQGKRMAKTTDPVALNQWYAVASLDEVSGKPYRTRLLGQDIKMRAPSAGLRRARYWRWAWPRLPVKRSSAASGRRSASPTAPIFDIVEAEEDDRRYVPCGWFNLRASGLRIVENFLDMAHFPFVHTDILGAEPHTDVPKYDFEIRRDVDEVWATNCTFFQPQRDRWQRGRDFAQLILSRADALHGDALPGEPVGRTRLDAIAAFIQPMEEDFCRAIPVMYLVDPDSQPYGAVEVRAGDISRRTRSSWRTSGRSCCLYTRRMRSRRAPMARRSPIVAG
jgi:hypothetical protein